MKNYLISCLIEVGPFGPLRPLRKPVGLFETLRPLELEFESYIVIFHCVLHMEMQNSRAEEPKEVSKVSESSYSHFNRHKFSLYAKSCL